MISRCLCTFVLWTTIIACCLPFGDDDDPSSASSETVAAEYDGNYVASHLARVAASPECRGNQPVSLAVFCPAASGWSTTTVRAPLGPVRSRAGLTTWVPTVGSVEGVDRVQRRFSVLSLSDDGESASITSPGQQDADTRAAMESVSRSLLSSATPTPIRLSAGLVSFLSFGSRQGLHDVSPTAPGWQIQGGSFADLRRVGDTWVAVEVPRNNPEGLYLSVFSDVPPAALAP